MGGRDPIKDVRKDVMRDVGGTLRIFGDVTEDAVLQVKQFAMSLSEIPPDIPDNIDPALVKTVYNEFVDACEAAGIPSPPGPPRWH